MTETHTRSAPATRMVRALVAPRRQGCLMFARGALVGCHPWSCGSHGDECRACAHTPRPYGSVAGCDASSGKRARRPGYSGGSTAGRGAAGTMDRPAPSGPAVGRRSRVQNSASIFCPDLLVVGRLGTHSRLNKRRLCCLGRLRTTASHRARRRQAREARSRRVPDEAHV
jgi:hypothetical protein